MRVIRFLTVLFALLLSACKSNSGNGPQLPEAPFTHPIEEEVTEWDEYSGRLESPQVVQLSARVSGIIEQSLFQEGAFVNKGDVLFVIDPRPFASELKSKEANLARAEAELAKAEAHFKRYDRLKGTRAVSAEDFDEATAALRQARAEVSGAEAAREVSALNLEWTKVTAPISGRISRKFVTEGNLVTGGSGSGDKTHLTTITSVDPIYCYVSIPERVFLRYQKIKMEGTDRAPCSIRLENETKFTRTGVITFVDSRVDPATGTVQIRGEFENKDGALTPGLFARMTVLGSEKYQALLIPETAIGTNQDSKFVLIIDEADAVQPRTIKTGALFGTRLAVVSGLSASDRVVTNGIQLLRPGTKVSPRDTNTSPQPTPSGEK